MGSDPPVVVAVMSDYVPVWVALITAVLGGGGVFAALGKKWLEDRKDKKASEKLVSNLEEIAKTYSVLNTGMAEAGSHRALLIKAYNGGGIPQPGRRVRISVISETRDYKLNEASERSQEVLTDSEYASLLEDLATKGFKFLVTSDLPTGSWIRQVYEADGVHASVTIRVGATDREFFYLSFNYTKHDILTAKSLVWIVNTATSLRVLLEKNNRLVMREGRIDATDILFKELPGDGGSLPI